MSSDFYEKSLLPWVSPILQNAFMVLRRHHGSTAGVARPPFGVNRQP
jgi:hypothetical protein